MDCPQPLINAVYYPSWRVYKDIPPSSLPVDAISALFYAFAIPGEDGSLQFLDAYADAEMPVDGERGCLAAVAALKRAHPHLRTLLSIGGGGEGSAAFAVLAATAAGRAALAQSVRAWVERYDLDGVDIDWEHPQTPAQGRQHVLLLQAVRAALPAPRYRLSTALPADPSLLRHVVDVPGLAAAAAAAVDHVVLMGYDLAGPWSRVAGHHAPLFSGDDDDGDDGHAHRPSSSSAVRCLLDGGLPPHRILLGIPAYARVFPGARGPGDAFRRQADEAQEALDYRDVPRAWKDGAQIDRARGTAWFVGGGDGDGDGDGHNDDGDGDAAFFVSMDVPETVRIKAAFAHAAGLGGLVFWTGAGDGVGDDSLVAAGYDGLLHPDRDRFTGRT